MTWWQRIGNEPVRGYQRFDQKICPGGRLGAGAGALQHPLIGTAALTQVEMACAMSKAARLGWVGEPEISIAWQDFLSHWEAYIRLPVSPGVVERASALSWRHALRAYYAIHLASALIWGEVIGDRGLFACYDATLCKAARGEGLQVWPL